MIKSICFLSRRPDIPRSEFHRYYEDHHAPLAARIFPLAKYVRNHLQDHGDAGFDTISEFWSADPGGAAALMEGPVGDRLHADERRFMDQSAIRPAGSAERLLAGTARGLERPGRDKLAILLHRAAGASAEAFRLATEAWGRRLGESAERVTLDLLGAETGQVCVCDAILWLWPLREAAEIGAPPAEAVVWRRLRVRPAETPPENLISAIPGGGD